MLQIAIFVSVTLLDLNVLPIFDNIIEMIVVFGDSKLNDLSGYCWNLILQNGSLFSPILEFCIPFPKAIFA